MSELTMALLEFQKSAPHLGKDGQNPHFGNRFPTLENVLETVRPRLNEQGLVLMQFPTVMADGSGGLRTCIVHAESGESVEDVMLLNAGRAGPQEQGSAITYARRYAILAILGLVADDDDDGNAASRSAGDPYGNTTATPVAGATAPASPAENPVEKAKAAAEAAKAARAPTDGGIPSNVVIHFGKNQNVALGDLSPRQLSWYADKWAPGDSPQDRRLKMAAQAFARGADDPDFDVPF